MTNTNDPIIEPTTEPATEPTPAGANEPVNDPTADNTIPYDRFKQKVDEANALKKKLADIEDKQKADEKKQLEEQNEYKELYERTLEQMETYQADALNAKKGEILTQAGYTKEQIEVLRGTVTGETDEEITASVESLKSVITPAPTYADPSVGNSAKKAPAKKDLKQIGRESVEKFFNKS